MRELCGKAVNLMRMRKVDYGDIRVVHTGYSTPEVVRAKKERYLGIMERWLEEHPENYIVR